MMTLEVALVMTVGGIVGSILVSQMWQMNWFKRENFKFKQSMDRKENSIRFRRLERDLKLKEAPTPQEIPQEKSFIDTIKNIDPEMIKTLAGAFQKDDRDQYEYADDYKDEKPDLTEIIADVAKSNPELVNKLVDKITKKPGDADNFTTQG